MIAFFSNIDIITLAIYLIITSVQDIRTRDISIWLHVPILVVGLCTHFDNLALAVILFILMLVVAIFGDMGGADCIVMAMITLILGPVGVWGCLCGFILTIPYGIWLYIKRKKNKDINYPLIPFLTAGTAGVLSILL